MKTKNILIALAVMSLAVVGCGRQQRGGGSNTPNVTVVNYSYNGDTDTIHYEYKGVTYNVVSVRQTFLRVENDNRVIYFPEQVPQESEPAESPTEETDEGDQEYHVLVGTPEEDGTPSENPDLHVLDKETYDELKEVKDAGEEATQAQLEKVLESPKSTVGEQQNPYEPPTASSDPEEQ